MSEIALGGYAEDYIFNVSNGHLDERNGRLTNTPEYPNGTYAYFITVDEAGDTAFPHILGDTFYGVPVSQRNVTLPGNAVQFIPPSVLGDFSNDGVVDVTDIDFYSGLIGVTSSDAAYDERLDFDLDGTIELSMTTTSMSTLTSKHPMALQVRYWETWTSTARSACSAMLLYWLHS